MVGTANLKNFRVLVLEDEFFLGLEITDILHEMGIDHVDMTMTLDGAFDLLGQERFGMGFLNVRIQNKMSFPVADQMVKNHIPFAFVTGCGREELPPRFKGAKIVSKPYDERAIVNNVRTLIRWAANL